MSKPSIAKVKESLYDQLRELGADVDCYRSLVEDYCFYDQQERKMQADVRKRGLSYEAVSAAGKEYEKENPSVKLAYQYNKQKIQILRQMGLTVQTVVNPDEEEEEL